MYLYIESCMHAYMYVLDYYLYCKSSANMLVLLHALLTLNHDECFTSPS